MTAFNLYEAYAAVYDEELREDLLSVDEDFDFIDDLSDNELVQIMEEILSEEEVTLQECLDVFDAELISEETEMQRMNRLQNKATREKKAAAATAGRMKSAERERVGRKHAVKRLQVAASRAGRNLADRAKSAGQKAKSMASSAASAASSKASEAKAKVTGKLAAAKERIKGAVKSGRSAVAGGLRKVASKIEPKETESKGKEVKAAARKAISGTATRKALPPVGKTKSGKTLTQSQRNMQTAAQNKRLAARLGEDLDLLTLTILEDLISEGYAEDFDSAVLALESLSDFEVGEIAESYLVEEVETVDLYDVILEHLLDEGYADTKEAATVIMANMSEEWKNEILK